jgi:methionine aminotransferase
MSEFRKVYQFNAFCSFAPAQYAFLDMISDPSTYEGVSSFYQEKRDKMASLLSGSIFKVLHSSGSYFQLLDYKNYSDESDYLLAKRLTEAFGIAMIPMSSFYHNKKDQKLLRICFAKEDETLEKAAAILNSIR